MQLTLTKPNEIIHAGYEPQLADGVRGYAVRYGGWIWIPVIIADREGSGAVGRFLDVVEPSETVAVPNVLHPRLVGMLLRRGWHLACDVDTGTNIAVRGPVRW